MMLAGLPVQQLANITLRVVAMAQDSADVIIVGAGVVGCAAANALASAGLRPLVVERDAIASHASGFAFGELLPWWGPGVPGPLFPLARECMALHRDLNPALKEETGIDTGFGMRSALSIAFDQGALRLLHTRGGWLAEENVAARRLSAEEVRRIEPRISPEVAGGLYVDEVGILESYKLVLALAEAAERRGATIRHGNVNGIEWQGERAVAVRLDSGRIGCGHLVLAAGPWTRTFGKWLGTPVPVRPQRGQILRLELSEKPVLTYLAWDNCYATTKEDGLLWAGSTEEEVGFDERLTPEGRDFILKGLVRALPAALEARVVNHTACLRPISADGLPILGLIPGTSNVYAATGTGRNGLLLAPGIGLALAQLITQRGATLPIAPFSPARFSGAGLGQ